MVLSPVIAALDELKGAILRGDAVVRGWSKTTKAVPDNFRERTLRIVFVKKDPNTGNFEFAG